LCEFVEAGDLTEVGVLGVRHRGSVRSAVRAAAHSGADVDEPILARSERSSVTLPSGAVA
jgi:hypothetical protein